MGRRVVITGLGATTLEQAMSDIARPERDVSRPEKVERVAVKAEEPPQLPPNPMPRPMPLQQPVNEATYTNLDLPAFLRRRARFAG